VKSQLLPKPQSLLMHQRLKPMLPRKPPLLPLQMELSHQFQFQMKRPKPPKLPLTLKPKSHPQRKLLINQQCLMDLPSITLLKTEDTPVWSMEDLD